QTGFSTVAPDFTSQGRHRYVIQTAVKNPVQISQLSRWLEKNNFDVAGTRWRNGEVEVITTDEGVNLLKAKGFHLYALKSVNLEAESRPDPHYLNPESLTEKLKAINQAYPNLTRVEEIGKSLQGRPIYAMLISDTPKAGDPRELEKPVILFDGLHHARE